MPRIQKNFSKKSKNFVRVHCYFPEVRENTPKDSRHIFYEHWSINFSQLTRFLKKKKNQELPSEFFAKKNVYLSVLFHLSYLSYVDFI